MTTRTPDSAGTKARKEAGKKMQTWSKRVDSINRARGVDLDAVLAKARRDYHEPSDADRQRLAEKVRLRDDRISGAAPLKGDDND